MLCDEFAARFECHHQILMARDIPAHSVSGFYVLNKLNDMNMCPNNLRPYIMCPRWEGSKKSLTSSEHSEFPHKSEIHQFLELSLNTLECKWLAWKSVLQMISGLKWMLDPRIEPFAISRTIKIWWWHSNLGCKIHRTARLRAPRWYRTAIHSYDMQGCRLEGF
jgi:hypothetical protein